MFSCTPADETTDPIPHTGCGCCNPEVRSVARRIDRELSRRGFIAGAGASLASLGFAPRAKAQAADAPPVLFSNFLLFDGKSRALKGGLRLLVEGGRIKALASGDFSPPAGARLIDCGGRTLMPGLIDAHWHTIFAGLPIATLLNADIGYIMLAAADEAERTLMRGFTTVRDLGGPAFGLKQAIDDGLAIGPRIYPSGAMITSSGGHGDLRPLSDLPRDSGGAPTGFERSGAASIADGADQVRLRAARATDAGGLANQAHRKRRRVVAADDARYGDVQRGGAARGGRDRGRPADLRRGARLSAGCDRARDLGRRAMHRARPSHG